MINSSRQNGFTLVEVLISLALVTLLSVIALNVLVPWLTFKQSLDSDRKLQDTRQAFQSAYAANAMASEENTGQQWLNLKHDTAIAGESCGGATGDNQLDALSQAPLSTYLAEAGRSAARDGTATPLCFFISPQLFKDIEGVRIYYHMIAVVSTGQNGVLDAGTSFNSPIGQLTLDPTGDDRGVLVNGFAIQYAKYRETLDRMNRVASLYENYFTTRFLNTADRDVSRDYFYQNGIAGDTGGSIQATSGWTSVQSALSTVLGISASDVTSTFEEFPALSKNNLIEVGNNAESVTVSGQSTTVRSPASLGTGATPPYTALLRSKLPGPNNYAVRAVVGNY